MTTPTYASPTTTEPRPHRPFPFLNGTDPALQIPLRMTYTTRPSQYRQHRIEKR
uniref:Uncharacterized protein n=1 Tax=Heterorhabditis bacteriophora TaxID=37862 RepID=A0A1I7X293_HETBA